MAGIRGKDTQPELNLRRALHALGLRYRLHAKDLPGSPDLVFPQYRAAVFVHGCFWHRHEGCKYATLPATRSEFWQAKFDKNVARDKRDGDALVGSGWRVAIAWECDLKPAKIAESANRIAEWLRA